jgi:predicted MFS family arabinose efflux permease
VLLWEGSAAQFFTPAEQAMLPGLVRDDELVTANAVSGQIQNLARLTGSGLGGVIAATGGITAVALADAASFLVSAALIALIKTIGLNAAPGPAWRSRARVAAPAGASAGPAGASAGPAPRSAGSLRRQVSALRAELADGLAWSLRHRTVRAVTVFIMVTSVGEGIMSTLFAPFVRHVLHGSSQAFGVVAAVQAVGGILGGLLAASAGQRISPARMLSYGAVAFGLVDLAIFLYPLGYAAVWPAAAGMVIVGFPGALTIAGAMTLLQRNTGDTVRGRVFGALGAAEGVAILAGTVCAGLLGQVAGIIPVLAVQGGGYVVAGIAMAVALAGRARPLPAGQDRPPAAGTSRPPAAGAGRAPTAHPAP